MHTPRCHATHAAGKCEGDSPHSERPESGSPPGGPGNDGRCVVSSRPSPRPRPERPLPTYRAPAAEQLAVTKGICLSDGPFTARDLEAVCGVRAERVQLTLAFWRTCGLVERVPGRGMYRATKVAQSAARAWRAGDEQGRRAILGVLKTQWFARSVKPRLAAGPGLRTGVVTKLMRLAQVGEDYRREVEMLVDLMITVRMVVPHPDGYLSWYDHKPAPAPTQAAPSATVPPQAIGEDAAKPRPTTQVPHAEQPDEEKTPLHCTVSAVPPPRTSAGDVAAEDLVALLSQPVRLADLARLSPDDLLSLHGHLAGLSATAAKLRSRPTSETLN